MEIITSWWNEVPAVITLIIMIGLCVVILTSLAITFMVWIGTKIKEQRLKNKRLKKEIENELEIE